MGEFERLGGLHLATSGIIGKYAQHRPGVVDGPVVRETPPSKSTEFVLRIPLPGWRDHQPLLRKQLDALDEALDNELNADLVEELTRETPGPSDRSPLIAEFFIVTPEPEVLLPVILAILRRFPITKDASMIRRRALTDGRGKRVALEA